MDLSFSLAVVLVALLVEAAAGYPHALFRAIGHPVTWMGRLIRLLDERMNQPALSEAARRRKGVIALVVLLVVSPVPVFILQDLMRGLLPDALAVLPLGIVASTMIAQRSLYSHVRAVAEALQKGGLDAGRRAVSKIVGRDPETLDESAVVRAAIESLAENFSDGVVAPVFWGCLLGLPGMVAHKAINTADSMIGHLSPRYASFGRASAKLDDWVNMVPARLSAVYLAASCLLRRDADAKLSWTIATEHSHRHRSPNAGWPEGATAGALGIKLAGPRSYGGRVTEDRFIGRGREDLTPDDILRALALYRIACGLQIALVALLAFFI